MPVLAVLLSILAAYAFLVYWRMGILKLAIKQCRPVGPEWLRGGFLRLAKFLANVVGVRIASLDGEGLAADKSRRYMYAWHPHGFISYVPSYLMGDMATSGAPHGRVWFGTCAPILFNLPVLGEHFTMANARPVDKRTLEHILGHQNGSTIAVQPGGIKEQAATRHDQEQAFFPKRLGFIRLAIKYQTPLMPLYIFGENQLYRRVNGMEWLTKTIYKLTGLTFPILTSKFGLPMCLFTPIATDIHIRYGRPVEVGKQDDEPSDAHVEEVFERYLAELRRLFAAHADSCLPKEVAARGLKVVRL